jgi:hypothetical protein
MPIDHKDYTDALNVMEKSVRALTQQLPDKKWELCLQSVENMYSAVLSMDLYLRDKIDAQRHDQ